MVHVDGKFIHVISIISIITYFFNFPDILFRKPVEIGSLLYLSSQVVYTQGHYVMVRVSAEVVHPESGTHDLTNVFHFTLRTDKEAPEVIPRSYQGFSLFAFLLEEDLYHFKGHTYFFFFSAQRPCCTLTVGGTSWTLYPRPNFEEEVCLGQSHF